MYALDISSVTAWEQVAGFWFPVSVDARCPFCGRAVNLKPTDHNIDRYRNTIASTAQCPGCRKTTYIWAIEPGPASDSSKKQCKCLAMFPAPQLPRQPIDGVHLVPERIGKAYLEVLQVFNAGVWSATATCCRRTLEGIISNLLPDGDHTASLAQQLKKLGQTKAPELAKPIITLSHSLREGGNLGAHFDKKKEPDGEMATAMLDLIEYLIEFVYTLPAMIERLDKKLGPSSKETA